MKFGIESSNDELILCLNDEEDREIKSIDCHLPSPDVRISIDEEEIFIRWLEGISQYQLSLPVEQITRKYSPLNEKDIQIDCDENLRSLKWSIDLLKENLIRSYLISLPNQFQREQYSIDEPFQLNISINEQNIDEYSISIESNFEQRLSLSTNDIKEQILSFIDSIEKKQNFGNDQQMKIIRWSLEELKTLVCNLSPIEIVQCFYSPIDGKGIEYENVFIGSEEGNARALRRYRCKHFSIKSNEIYQLDSQNNSHLQFKGNESIAIGDEHINNDLQQEQQLFKGLFLLSFSFNSYFLLQFR